MSITLPTPLRTYQYRPLTVFSLLDTDTDRVLPQLFEMCVKGGRSSRSRTNASDFAGYRDAMLEALGRPGFTTDARPRAARRLAALVRGRHGTRSGAARPASRCSPSHRSPWPPTVPACRRSAPGTAASTTSSTACCSRSWSAGEPRRRNGVRARTELRELVARTVGRGLTIGPEPRWEPQLADAGAARHRGPAGVPVRRGLRDGRRARDRRGRRRTARCPASPPTWARCCSPTCGSTATGCPCRR